MLVGIAYLIYKTLADLNKHFSINLSSGPGILNKIFRSFIGDLYLYEEKVTRN